MEENNKAVIILFSGDMDKVFAAFTIATGAAAAGMDTTLFCTFWGLKAIQKGNLTGTGLMGKMMGVMNRGGLKRLNPSKFSFGGAGRIMFTKMMNDKGVSPLSDLLKTMNELGVHLLGCKMSMDVMEIKREDLIDEVEDVVGVATFIKEAADSKIQLFI
jgi:peroxiredoxin family protein